MCRAEPGRGQSDPPGETRRPPDADATATTTTTTTPPADLAEMVHAAEERPDAEGWKHCFKVGELPAVPFYDPFLLIILKSPNFIPRILRLADVAGFREEISGLLERERRGLEDLWLAGHLLVELLGIW